MHDSTYYVQPLPEYSTLDSYNIATEMHFPKRTGVPSSKFPTLPEIPPKTSIDVLTHGTDMNYPTVMKAYGTFEKPKYYVGKCPSNDFVWDFGETTPPTTPAPHSNIQ